MTTTARRRQPPITIRSAKAAARLALLTRDGRSQAQVIEEALDRMPVPPVNDRQTIVGEIAAILASVPRRAYPSQTEIDDALYDENGLPR